MTTTTYDYTDGASYTYDSDLIEFTGGIAKLKDVRPTGSTCAALYADSINLSWGGGVLTGTGTGTPVITSGKLDLTGALKQYVDYAALANANSQQTGCMRADITPNYSGNPATSQYFFLTAEATGANVNVVTAYHFTNGAIYVVMTDSTGATITVSALSVFNPTAGTTYTIELNWDITAGATRLFVDGVRSGATITATGTRSSSIGLLRIGDYSTIGSAQSNFKIDNFVYFTTVQHTAAHAGELPFDPPYKHSIANPTIVTNGSFKASELTGFSETGTRENGDEIKHIITVNSIDKYVNGATVETSDGTYAKSNIDDDINTYIEDFIADRSTIKIKSFLHSDGSTTPELDSVTITYNSALPDPTLPDTQDLEGFIYKITGAKANLPIKIRPYQRGRVNSGVFQLYEYETVGTTNADGWFEGGIYLNGSSSNLYEIKIGTQSYTIDVSSATDTIDLSTLTLSLVEAT